MNKNKKMAVTPLSRQECEQLLDAIQPAIQFLGSPGDWGYGTKLGDLTIYLNHIQQEVKNEGQKS